MIAGGRTRRALRAAGDKPLVHFGGASWSGSFLDEQTDSLASFLQRRAGPRGGVGPRSSDCGSHVGPDNPGVRASVSKVPRGPDADAAAGEEAGDAAHDR